MSIDFQRHADAIYAALGRPATWLPHTGPPKAVSLVRSSAAELLSIRGLDFVGEGDIWHVRVSEAPEPKQGDHFELDDGRLIQVQAPPRLHGRRDLQWYLDCHVVESVV